MIAPTALTLINPKSKNLAFSIDSLKDDSFVRKFHRNHYFSLILVTKGGGKVIADVSEYPFSGNSLLCFSLYQPFLIKSEGVFKGILIDFHPEFFCLHKHRNEVSCNGVLFNNIYESPVLSLDEQEMQSLVVIAGQMEAEMQHTELAQLDVLISYLKVFLITATRTKLKQRQDYGTDKEPQLLQTLKEAIEVNYRTLHSAGEYADLLNISTKALNKVSKAHFNKTLSGLITERIIIEAKRELYLTSKAIKLIAYELGFNDEFYFSRFFKTNVAVSPQHFRDTVGFDRANA